MTPFYPFTMLAQDPYGVDYVWPDSIELPLDKDGGLHFSITTWGPWSLVNKLNALAITTHLATPSFIGDVRGKGITVWGFRNLEAPRESGYDYVGRVKVNGSRFPAFTSQHTITYRGKLATLAVLYVCNQELNG